MNLRLKNCRIKSNPKKADDESVKGESLEPKKMSSALVTKT